MNTKHTKGPWRAECAGSEGYLVFSDAPLQEQGLGPVADCTAKAFSVSEANAARIVACVNACQGINPEAVPELLAALRAAMKAVDEGAAFIPAHVGMKASAAIAKAEGR